MEEVKSSIRDYNKNEQYRQSVTGPPVYYRVSVNSGYRVDGSTVTDAEFDVKHVFPNHRMDLMNGEWHAFLEYFEADIPSQIKAVNLKVCLPELIKSSHDYVMTSKGVCQLNDIVGHVPIAQEYRRPAQAGDVDGDGDDDVDDDAFDTLAPLPISISNVIGTDSIGVKIDPVALSSGQLRVLLRSASHSPLVEGDAASQMPNGEAWTATFLFVHKS